MCRLCDSLWTPEGSDARCPPGRDLDVALRAAGPDRTSCSTRTVDGLQSYFNNMAAVAVYDSAIHAQRIHKVITLKDTFDPSK